MNRRSTALLTGLVLALCAAPALAAKKETVYPTGDPAIDVPAVQAAIDRASTGKGVVVLRARNRNGVPTAFDFGDDGQVVIGGPGGDIKLVGQGGDDDGDDDDYDEDYAHTAIFGGNVPILMQRPARLTVRNIQFSGAFLHAILVTNATGVTIKNNQFLDTVGFPDFFIPPGCDPAVDCTGFNPLTRVIYLEGQGFDADQITGKVVISGNIIDTAMGGFTDGIASFFTNAETRIIDNQVSGVNVAIRIDEFFKPLRIADNYLSAHVPAPGFFAAGATVSCGASLPISIKNNYVSAADDTGPAGFAVGLLVAAFNFSPGGCTLDGASVRGNDITLSNAGVGINGIADPFLSGPQRFLDNVIADNVIRGSAFFAGISLESFGDDVEIFGNQIRNNDLSGLQSDIDVFLGPLTDNNTAIVGPDDVVVDLGVDNDVVIADDDEEEDDD